MTGYKHDELTEALRLLDISLRQFSQTLISPNSGRPISHTAVIRVAQGHADTDWIKQEIDTIIERAKKKFPGYYEDKSGAAHA